jgi:hypothetical protein
MIIYNEDKFSKELRDLLLPPGQAPVKLEIRSGVDPARAGLGLGSPSTVTTGSGVQIPSLTRVEVSTAEEVCYKVNGNTYVPTAFISDGR